MLKSIDNPDLARPEIMGRASDGPGFFPSLTRLRAFSEVARFDSISRASAELRRSQSAVTQAVQNLEQEVGVELFQRASTGSYLTKMGRILQRRTDRCLLAIRNAVQTARRDGNNDPRVISNAARCITRAQILALTAVSEHGSFAQAARYASVSLTSLHRAARGLEKQLGRQLFFTTAQGVVINPAGTRLSSDLLLAIRELEWALEEINAEKGELRGRLLVGSLLLAGNQYIAVAVDRFVSLHPEVNLRLDHGSYGDLLSKLRGGSIDFLVGQLKNPAPVDDVRELPLRSEKYVVAVRRGHPLAAKQRITRRDLLGAEWVAPRPSAQRRRVFEDIFGPGPLPRYAVETHSLLTILVMLSESERLALMTESELGLDRRLGNHLVALDYKIDAPPIDIGVTIRDHWEQSRLQCKFLSFLRTQQI